jgi:hypothetical protein
LFADLLGDEQGKENASIKPILKKRAEAEGDKVEKLIKLCI